MKIFYTFYSLSTGRIYQSVDRLDPIKAMFFIFFYIVTELFGIYILSEYFLRLCILCALLFLGMLNVFVFTCNSVEFLTDCSNNVV